MTDTVEENMPYWFRKPLQNTEAIFFLIYFPHLHAGHPLTWKYDCHQLIAGSLHVTHLVLKRLSYKSQVVYWIRRVIVNRTSHLYTNFFHGTKDFQTKSADCSSSPLSIDTYNYIQIFLWHNFNMKMKSSLVKFS